MTNTNIQECKDVSKVSIPKERIDLNAMWVVRRLRAKGYEAYLTGGCVRDLLLGKQPKDFDVATSAKPEEVKAIFGNCRLIGRRFLLAHVVFPGGKIIETATFRANPVEEVNSEEENEDLLVIQDNVFGTVKEDAFRRDLTINGLFYDPIEEQVIDYVGGLEDLQKGLIRTIGDADIRLQEDPARIIRAIRFANTLGFQIEEKTFQAMCKYSKELLRCAPARLQEEIVRLLLSKKSKENFALALEVGALHVLMPELLEGLCEKAHGLENDEEISIEQVKQSEAFIQWQNMLGVLDSVAAKDCLVFSSVAFTCLLLPAYEILEKSSQNERNWIDRLCVSWAERIRLTRRDQDVIRVLLTSISLFSPEKTHSSSARYLLRKMWFREGLLVFTIYLESKKQPLSPVLVWKKLASDANIAYKQEKLAANQVGERFRKTKKPNMMNRKRFFNSKFKNA
jgi:poly(A) polymerase